MNSVAPRALDQFIASNGQSLAAMSEGAPVLIVFLRHSGCPFCRQTLADLAANRATVDRAGLKPVLVHMMSDAGAREHFGQYQLSDLPRISDPDGKVYQAFGMQPGTVSQVMGPRVWWPALKAMLLEGHRLGRPKGDVFRLPGAFVVKSGQILESFQPANSFERIDFKSLTECANCNVNPAN